MRDESLCAEIAPVLGSPDDFIQEILSYSLTLTENQIQELKHVHQLLPHERCDHHLSPLVKHLLIKYSGNVLDDQSCDVTLLLINCAEGDDVLD